MTLISETHNQVLQLSVTTSRKKNGRKFIRAFTAESIYHCYFSLIIFSTVELTSFYAHYNMNLSTTSRCVQSNPTIEALPGVLGNRGIRPFILGERREQKSKTEENRGTKAILGKREHKKLYILILRNKGKYHVFF